MPYLSLRTIRYIQGEIENTLKGYSVEHHRIGPLSKAIIVENAYVLYFGVSESVPSLTQNAIEMFCLKQGATDYINAPEHGRPYYTLHIEELTYNTIGFEYSHSHLLRKLRTETGIRFLSTAVTYNKFRGYERDVQTLARQIEAIAPYLKLKERYDAWEGVSYYFVVMEFKDCDGGKEFAMAYTTRHPHSYIVSTCKKWIASGLNWIGDDCTYENICGRDQGACRAFNSWKDKPRQYRLENHFRYCCIKKNIREKAIAKSTAVAMLRLAYEGGYADEVWGAYERPVYKWVTEKRVFQIVKRLYKENKVIYQHRPFFLKTADGAQMSYDVFIPGLNVAIEYQGEQHYRPVDYFGGEEGYRKTVARDERKRELSAENGITLVYITWQEKVTPELIRKKIGG